MVVSESAEFTGQLAAEAAGIAHVTVGVAAMDMADFTPQGLIDNINGFRTALGLDPTTEVPWAHRTRFVTAVPRLLLGDPDGAPDGTVFYRHQDAESGRPTEPAQPRSATPASASTRHSAPWRPASSSPREAYPPVLAALGQVDADVLFIIGSLDPATLGPVPANVKLERYVPNEVAMACDAVRHPRRMRHDDGHAESRAAHGGGAAVRRPAAQRGEDRRVRCRASACRCRDGIGDLPAAVAAVLDDPAYADAARRIAADLATLPTAADVLAQLRPVTVH